MGMFTQNEILIMIGVVSVLLICITILTILDIKEYLKAKKTLVKEVSIEENVVSNEVEPVNVVEVEDTPNVLINEIKEEKKEEVYFEEMEDEQFDTKVEVNPIIEEEEEVYVPKLKETKVEVNIPQVEQTKVVINVPEVEETKVKVEVPEVEIKEEKKELDVFEELEETINNLPNKKDDVTNFEAEQERTAIISLDELMKRSNELYTENEIDQYDDGDEPISIDEVIKMFNREEDKVEKLVTEVKEEAKEIPKVYQEVVEEKVPYSKKETIPFISSVYGIEKDNNALEFENTATYEKLDRQNYNDFVAQLKEMNENK